MKKLLLSAFFLLGTIALSISYVHPVNAETFNTKDQQSNIPLQVTIDPWPISTDTKKVTFTVRPTDLNTLFFKEDAYDAGIYRSDTKTGTPFLALKPQNNTLQFVYEGGFKADDIKNWTLEVNYRIVRQCEVLAVFRCKDIVRPPILSLPFSVQPPNFKEPEICAPVILEKKIEIPVTLKNTVSGQWYTFWIHEKNKYNSLAFQSTGDGIYRFGGFEGTPGEDEITRLCLVIGKHDSVTGTTGLSCAVGNTNNVYGTDVMFMDILNPEQARPEKCSSQQLVTEPGSPFGPQGPISGIYCDRDNPNRVLPSDTKPEDLPTNYGISTAIGCIPISNTNEFAAWVLRWALGIAGGVAFLLMLFAGFQIMTASGNPERLQKGRELLTAAISGLILIIFSVFLLKLIGVEILNLPGFGQ